MDFESIMSAIPSPRPGSFEDRTPRVPGPFQTYTARPMDIQRALSLLSQRIDKAREELRIVEEQLLFQMDVLEEAKTRMLVAETPLADREYRVARDDHERLVVERDRVTQQIAELQLEQDRLLDRMLAMPPTA